MLSKDYRILLLMQQVVNAVKKARRNELLPHGITLEEFMVLYILQDAEGPVIPSRISHLLCQERNTVSTHLDRMARKNLVKRVRNFKNDRRLTRVTITTKGKSIFGHVQEAQARKEKGKGALTSIFSSFSREEYEQFSEFLLRLRKKALEEIETKGLKWKPPVP